MVLSTEECKFLVEHVFRCGGEYTQDVQEWFQAQFPETKVPLPNTVRQLIQKLKETGSMCDATRSGKPSILTEKKVLDISERMLQSPKKSIRKLSQQVGGSHSTAHTALKTCLCLHSSKITTVHELKPGDSAKRVAYCKQFFRLSCPGRRGHFGCHILHRRGIVPFLGIQQSKLTCLVCTQSSCVPWVTAAW